MSQQISRKSLVVLVIATIVGVWLYFVAPPDMQPGFYQATLTVDSPELNIEHDFNITFVEGGVEEKSVFSLTGVSINLTITFTSVVPIAPNSPMSIEITVTGDTLMADQIAVTLANEDGFNVLLRPTKQSGQVFYVNYQPLAHSSAAVMILGVVAILWFTEGISLVATAMLIPVLVILTEVQTPTAAFGGFFDPAVALILGGFLIGRALSKYELDKRLALLILSHSPASGSSLLLTVMGVTAFLSMWISNTASAAIMIPIALAVVSRIKSGDIRSKYTKALVLGVAYAATIGGVGSLVGSPPNPLAASYINSFLGIEFSFMDWLPFGLPVLLIMLPIVWQWLMFRFKLPRDIEEMRELKNVSENEYLKLGPMTRQQKYVIAVFISVIALWLTQRIPDVLANVIGWSGHGISSATVAIMGGVSLMVLRLLDEKDVSTGINWSALLILGSGIVLGRAMIDSGISTFIAQQMAGLGIFPAVLVVVIIGGIAVMLTMVASNTGAAVILIPIAIPLATGLGIDPMLVTMVIAIGVTMDFALPTGTPPSTMAYSTGVLEMREMVSTGLVLDLIAVLVLTLGVVFLWSLMGLVAI